MAKGKKEKTDYGALSRQLRENGPDRLYLLWGQEDYLRESFFQELKSSCLSSGAEDFNYHRLNGASMDYQQLAETVNAVPFLGERTFSEIRDFDINACKDEKAERLKDIFSDIPDYATLVFLMPTGYEPDGRQSAFKLFKKQGQAIEFTTQPQAMLIKWIKKRFAAFGKTIENDACEKLVFISGDMMTRLIPEIEKIAGYVQEQEVTRKAVEKLAMRIPEASVFEMTDKLADKDYDAAAKILAELLQSGEPPIKILAMIGFQMRRLYTAKVALEQGLGRDFVVKTYNIGFTYLADKLLTSARSFSLNQLKAAVELCAQADYSMKSSSRDDEDILKELILRMAVGERA